MCISNWLRRILLGVGCLVVSMAWADSYPSRSIKIVVPVAAGGGTDHSARTIAQKLTEALGQTVIVENKPGASGNIGVEHVARAEADGYTLVMPMTSFPVNPSLFSKLPFDTVKDFSPVALVGSLPLVLVVHPAVKANSVEELIELSKQKPGSINFANSGSGTTAHLAGEMFKRMANVDIVGINYKGGGPAVRDLLGGEVQMYFATLASVLPHLQAGTLRPLAVTGKQRLSELPQVPTVAESGLPNFEITAWFGIFAPAGTPQAVVQRLNTEIVKILKMPEMQQSFQKQGIYPESWTPQELAQHLEKEIEKWRVVVKDANIRVE